MSVENQAAQQLLVFGQSILLGLSAGLLYDLLRPFRVRAPRATGAVRAAWSSSQAASTVSPGARAAVISPPASMGQTGDSPPETGSRPTRSPVWHRVRSP